MVITRVGLVTSNKKENKNYFKIICFGVAAARPKDAGYEKYIRGNKRKWHHSGKENSTN
jgi:hypothetical protein